MKTFKKVGPLSIVLLTFLLFFESCKKDNSAANVSNGATTANALQSVAVGIGSSTDDSIYV
ncbi:MAG: hypothetical protein ABIS01_05890, partial [Ferruginibacter sp.]